MVSGPRLDCLARRTVCSSPYRRSQKIKWLKEHVIIWILLRWTLFAGWKEQNGKSQISLQQVDSVAFILWSPVPASVALAVEQAMPSLHHHLCFKVPSFLSECGVFLWSLKLGWLLDILKAWLMYMREMPGFTGSQITRSCLLDST